MTPTDIDREISAIAGQMLRGEEYDNVELQRLISKRTNDLVRLPSVKGITEKWRKERRDAFFKRHGCRR